MEAEIQIDRNENEQHGEDTQTAVFNKLQMCVMCCQVRTIYSDLNWDFKVSEIFKGVILLVPSPQ